jgi:hypothetical protein
LSNYLENKIIDLIFRGGTLTTPSGLYVALFTVAPTAAGGGTEVTGGSYARAALAPTATNWAATNAAGSTAATSSGTSGTTSNNVAISFPAPTANWGTIVAVGIFDASTGGDLLFFANLTANKTVNSGDNPATINAAALAVTLS